MAAAPVPDPVQAARSSGLRYVSDSDPGIHRRRAGRGFVYIKADGHCIHKSADIRRFRSLVIPPAWTNVWICPYENGHLQAVGRDQRGRKQYRYHPLYRSVRDETKFSRLAGFAHALPQIRQRVRSHLSCPGLTREKVVAAVVRLLESTAIRVGNAEYVRQNGSFGLTTLRSRHVKVESGAIRFRFPAKSGQAADSTLNDPRLARIVRKCQQLPGQHLFTYIDDQGDSCPVTSNDVNQYLRDASGEDYTAKDFRTWIGTVQMVQALKQLGPAENATAAKRNIVQAIKSTAETLANRPATCRKYYVHPAVVDAYLDGAFFNLVNRPPHGPAGLKRDERITLRLIRKAASRS